MSKPYCLRPCDCIYNIMEEQGFYKYEIGAKRNELLFGQTLINKDWKLTLANKHEFSFPHAGNGFSGTVENPISITVVDGIVTAVS